MRQINPEWIKAVQDSANQSPYFELHSMQLLHLTPGGSRLAIELGNKHLQLFGNVHGGVVAGLIDAAAWWAIYTEVDDDLGLTTVEMKLNYLAPAREGRMIAFGRSIKVGKTIGLGEARIENQHGRLLAHGTITGMILPDLKIIGQEQVPAKFLSAS